MDRLKEVKQRYLFQVSYFIQLNVQLGYSRLKLTLKIYITFYIKISVNFTLHFTLKFTLNAPLVHLV
jgi:hypothetical protein